MFANSGSSSGAEGQASSVTAKEFKRMESELADARAEIYKLRSEVGTVGSGESAGSGGITRLSTRSGARLSSSSSGLTGVVSAEQLDLVDRRCLQLTQEKRDLLARQIQDEADKNEMNQKLIAAEKEVC